LVLLASLWLTACKQSPPPENRAAATPAPATKIAWPAVSSVLDGTDVVDIGSVSAIPFDIGGIVGSYRSEQGGAMLSLTVRRRDTMLEVERVFQEPGTTAVTKRYEFRTTTPEGAVSSQDKAFLKQTRTGLLLLEEQSGVESIPASYWVQYERQS
jgi:hypothetical protein